MIYVFKKLPIQISTFTFLARVLGAKNFKWFAHAADIVISMIVRQEIIRTVSASYHHRGRPGGGGVVDASKIKKNYFLMSAF